MFIKKQKGRLHPDWKPEHALEKAELRFRWGFFLLALGDTGHVGFRVWAYGLGSLDSIVMIGPLPFSLVGAGALATAVTVTFLYMLFLDIWRVQSGKKINAVYIILMLAGIIRLIIFFLPQNKWGSSVPPFEWGIIRNTGLTVLGLGVALLYIFQLNQSLFKRLGIYILLSYGFYIPVILFVRDIPVIGMLMIPKTIMYILIAIDAYRNLYSRKTGTQKVPSA